MQPVRVLVPASSANLGPGFDAFGLALALYNTVEMQEDEETHVVISGEGAQTLAKDASNLVVHAAHHLFDAAGYRLRGLRVALHNAIPLGRGLGSSAAAIVGGLVAANELAHRPMTRPDLLKLAAHLEGHPDNVAPALLGGLVVASASESDLLYTQVPLPPMRVVVVVPDFALLTQEARAVLPASVPRQDAVFNLARAALVLLALQRGDYELLARALDDRLHQPYRARLIPGMEAVFAAARAAGAAGVALSGAGPSLIAFAEGDHERIGEAMRRAWASRGVQGRALILEVDREGARVESISKMSSLYCT